MDTKKGLSFHDILAIRQMSQRMYRNSQDEIITIPESYIVHIQPKLLFINILILKRKFIKEKNHYYDI